MSTNVMPSWIKSLLLVAAMAACWWCWFGPSEPAYRNSPVNNQVSYSSGQENGLQTKASANIRQFVTNPLEPASLPDEGAVILRDTGTDYYRNEP